MAGPWPFGNPVNQSLNQLLVVKAEDSGSDFSHEPFELQKMGNEARTDRFVLVALPNSYPDPAEWETKP